MRYGYFIKFIFGLNLKLTQSFCKIIHKKKIIKLLWTSSLRNNCQDRQGNYRLYQYQRRLKDIVSAIEMSWMSPVITPMKRFIIKLNLFKSWSKSYHGFIIPYIFCKSASKTISLSSLFEQVLLDVYPNWVFNKNATFTRNKEYRGQMVSCVFGKNSKGQNKVKMSTKIYDKESEINPKLMTATAWNPNDWEGFS